MILTALCVLWLAGCGVLAWLSARIGARNIRQARVVLRIEPLQVDEVLAEGPRRGRFPPSRGPPPRA